MSQGLASFDVSTRRLSLQELSLRQELDAAICVDSMEFVPPEGWPLVLGNLCEAVNPGSWP